MSADYFDSPLAEVDRSPTGFASSAAAPDAVIMILPRRGSPSGQEGLTYSDRDVISDWCDGWSWPAPSLRLSSWLPR